jgi:hypothetical protein
VVIVSKSINNAGANAAGAAGNGIDPHDYFPLIFNA